MKEREKFLTSLSKILEVKKVKETDKFDSFKEWDSLTVLSVIALVHEMFKISISAEDFNKFKNVGKLITFIDKNKKGKK